MAEAPQPRVAFTELERVRRNRYLEARRAGMCREDAQDFASGERDIGELRKAVIAGCPKQLLARLLL